MREGNPLQTVGEDSTTSAESVGASGGRDVFPSLVGLFEARAELHPDRVAVSYGGDQFTYRQLRVWLDSLARHLRSRGVNQETIVGVCLERSPRYLVALMAILKAGGAFLPLDPRYPTARLHFMLQDSQTPLLITERRLLERVGSNPPATVLLDSDWGEIDRESVDSPSIPTIFESRDQGSARPQGLAYVIYTSGSTGKPKGVLCPQGGLINRLTWMSERYPYQPEERCCQIVALSFVDSVYEMFGPLLQGVELVIIPDEIVRGSPFGLVRTLEQNAITRIILVPSVLSTLLDCIASSDLRPRHLKYCYVSGELLLASLARRAREILPTTTLINFYGASELAHHATWFEVTHAGEAKSVPIGHPIQNTQVYVLDSEMQPVPAGVAGELYMSGTGIARGYLNRPELTCERFVKSPFDTRGSRLFKTGDLCRCLPDGNLEYLGRVDQQVKIRGHRIEPAEIEAALKEHPGVRETVVTARESPLGEQQLVAWVIPYQAGTQSAGDLRGFLKRILPDYLVPSQFVFVPVFPRLPNGKVNRRELAGQTRFWSEERPPFRAPLNVVEQRLQCIWQQLLKAERVGRDDDFFDLGGDSLGAARMAAMIEEQIHVNVPGSILFEAPTIAQLSRIIEGERASAYPRNIVPIQPNGSGVRFFCFGAGANLRPLAHELGEDQPFFGVSLEEQDLEGLTHPPALEEIARRMLESVRAFQPVGPYCLGGHSMHGLYAYEAARQLRADDQEVTLLLLFDTYLPIAARDRCSLGTRVQAHLWSLWEQACEKDVRGFFRHLGKLAPFSSSFIRRRTMGPAQIQSSARTELNRTGALRSILAAAEAAYSPQSYGGGVILIEAAGQPLGRAAGARFGWDRLCGGRLEIRTVEGDHDTILIPPDVRGLAEELRTHLEYIRGQHQAG